MRLVDKRIAIYNHVKELLQPDGTLKQFGNVSWYTNLEVSKRYEELVLYKRYTPKEYPQYDNYDAILTGEERCLNLRTFDDSDKRAAYERQNGICPMCGKRFEYEQMEADHITAWSKGGKTTPENCQMLCKKCNLYKAGK